jgi:hypothetical protein
LEAIYHVPATLLGRVQLKRVRFLVKGRITWRRMKVSNVNKGAIFTPNP